jgi:hypothetical protein
MTRHLMTLFSSADRERALKYVRIAPTGTRIEFKTIKRSLPQNDYFWSCLSAISAQKEHCGRKYPPEVWKLLFMHAWQKEICLIPSLDGREVVPLSRSSDLSREEMSDLLEFVTAWCAQNGIKLHHPAEEAEVA